MTAYELTPRDQALIAAFHRGAAAIGMDGTHSLAPIDRGVLEVASLASQITILKVLKALNLTGGDARQLSFRMQSMPVPDDQAAVDAQLQEIYASRNT